MNILQNEIHQTTLRHAGAVDALAPSLASGIARIQLPALSCYASLCLRNSESAISILKCNMQIRHMIKILKTFMNPLRPNERKQKPQEKVEENSTANMTLVPPAEGPRSCWSGRGRAKTEILRPTWLWPHGLFFSLFDQGGRNGFTKFWSIFIECLMQIVSHKNCFFHNNFLFSKFWWSFIAELFRRIFESRS